ncbi:hypothetical protein LCGC14_0110400 [marine sediment metagenome]|uniref:Uncharacterized protein n=1 Tax=marine sediment metagenome TaxID=412755 RepID=A0A0F9VDN7_9ZZZZ
MARGCFRENAGHGSRTITSLGNYNDGLGTDLSKKFVIPAKAGIQRLAVQRLAAQWLAIQTNLPAHRCEG